jgi:hypothetical protein
MAAVKETSAARTSFPVQKIILQHYNSIFCTTDHQGLPYISFQFTAVF